MRDLAVAYLSKRIEDLSNRARVSVIASGRRPRLLAGPAAFPSEALERLNDFEPTASHHDLDASLALAQELAGAGSVLLLTDRLDHEHIPPTVEVHAIGQGLENLALTGGTRTRGDAEEARTTYSVAPGKGRELAQVEAWLAAR